MLRRTTPESHTSATFSSSACSGTTTNSYSVRKLFYAGLALLLTADALAQSSPGKFELTPYGGFRFGGSFDDVDLDASAELDDDASFGLIVNLRESSETQWEIIYSQQSTSADASEFPVADPSLDLEIHNFQLGGTYMGQGERARPYVVATVGGTHISPDLSSLKSDTFWSFSIGGGLQVFPSQRLGLRLEARVWGTLLDSSTNLFCSSGPQGGLCAITVDGEMLWQLETFAGVVLRF